MDQENASREGYLEEVQLFHLKGRRHGTGGFSITTAFTKSWYCLPGTPLCH